MHTNFFLAQREYIGMISLSKRITAVVQARRSDTEDLIGGIRNEKSYQIKIGHSTPLINNLEIEKLFKDKDKEKGVSVTDLINRIVQVLRGDLYWVKISVQKAGLIELVES